MCRAIGLGWALALSAPVAAESAFDVSGGVTLTSDYLFYGVSQTMGDPAVQVGMDVETDAGWYSYLWASNVDFVPDNELDDGARYEVNVALGYATDLSDRWSLDAMLVRYIFPGTVDGIDYDYNDLVVTLDAAERVAATVGYSNDVFGKDADGWFYALSGNIDLPAELSLFARGGFYDLDAAFGVSYAFSVVAVSRSLGAVDLTLAWHDTYGDADELFYAQTIGSRVVLSLDVEFLR